MKRKSKIKTKKSAADMAFDSVNLIFLGLFAIACIYPFYYILINSVSNNKLVELGKIVLLPKGIHFNNFSDVLKIQGLNHAVFISVARTVVGTCISILSCTVLGYAMTRQELWHRKFWYRFMIVTMYFGAGLIPGYLNIKRLGLMNTFGVYVVPCLIGPYNMILVKTYIESIPQSLEESALMDGAGYLTRLMRIIVPLSKPILATIVLFSVVGQWNAYMDTVLYTSGTRLQTLQSILYQYLNSSRQLAEMITKSGMVSEQMLMQSANLQSARHTMTMVTISPILMVYPFIQRYYVKGVMIGAVKG